MLMLLLMRLRQTTSSGRQFLVQTVRMTLSLRQLQLLLLLVLLLLLLLLLLLELTWLTGKDLPVDVGHHPVRGWPAILGPAADDAVCHGGDRNALGGCGGVSADGDGACLDGDRGDDDNDGDGEEDRGKHDLTEAAPRAS